MLQHELCTQIWTIIWTKRSRSTRSDRIEAGVEIAVYNENATRQAELEEEGYAKVYENEATESGNASSNEIFEIIEIYLEGNASQRMIKNTWKNS